MLPAVCTAGELLEGGITVRVLATDTNEPVAGITVHFAVVSGQGTLAAQAAASGPDGLATVGFTCGPDVGPAVTDFEFSVPGQEGSSIGGGIEGTPGPPAAFRFSPPDSAPAVLAFLPLSVEATLSDRFGHPIAGAAVGWTIETGGGSLVSGSSTTSAAGATANQWYLGGSEGGQSILLTVPGTAVAQILHAQAFAQALQIVLDAPPATTLTAGVLVDGPFRVRVLTAGGSPVRKAPVLFEAERPDRYPGSGLDDGVLTPIGDADPTFGVFTDPNGYAAESYTAATKAGSVILLVRMAPQGSNDIAPHVEWDLTVVSGPLASLATVSGDDQSGTVGAPLAVPLIVVAQDQYGNARCSETVTWTADHGGTLANDVTPEVECRAQNTWTLGPDPGTQTVTATVAPGVSATFSATAAVSAANSTDLQPFGWADRPLRP